MPELPDLLYIQKHLSDAACHRTIAQVEVKQPIVLRVAIDAKFEDAIRGRHIIACRIHGPFICVELSDNLDLIMNLMLAGKLQHQTQNRKQEGYLCFSLQLDDGSALNFCDEQKMAKAYLVRHGAHHDIPKYREQGIDILSPDFTIDKFRQLAAQHSRKQVRVFINDHTVLSSIGNAYADEILFDARIHPKTFLNKVAPQQLDQLYASILSVMKWGIAQVEAASKPIHVKVRDHMKVRNRKGEPCPRCGTTIRREGVRGFNVFFCPTCQPASRKHFIEWNKRGI